jgi:hypothetical protein
MIKTSWRVQGSSRTNPCDTDVTVFTPSAPSAASKSRAARSMVEGSGDR